MPETKINTKESWLKLCDYCKRELLNYDSSMKFPKYLALRLKGLSEGNFISNKNIQPNANYSFDTILIACKICKPKIRDYFMKNSAKINDENHKINLILMFVEQEINDVVLRLKAKERSEQAVSELEFDSYNHSKSEYNTFEHKTNDKLEDLW